MDRDQEQKSVTDDHAAVQVAEERATIGTREVMTGRVRISTTTDTIEEVVRQELEGSQAEVIRMPIGRVLEPGETPPGVRTEGSNVVVPIFEEVLVIEKRLLLKEEMHIQQHTTVENVEIPITVRKQRATVERVPLEISPEKSSGEI